MEIGAKFGAMSLDGTPDDLYHPAQSREGRLVDLDQNRGDIVLAAAGIRELDEALHGAVRSELDDRSDVARLKVAVQAVAAEEEAIPRAKRDDRGIDLNIVAVADRPCDDVAVRRLLRLLGGDEPLLSCQAMSV
jgi:hypothetical protein